MIFGIALCIAVYAGIRSQEESRILLRHQEQISDTIDALLNDENFGYAILDEKGEVIEWNRALERLTGWPASEMLGKNLYEIMEDPESYEMHKEAYAKAIKQYKEVIEKDKDALVAPKTVLCRVKGYEGSPTRLMRFVVRLVRTRHGKVHSIAHGETQEQAEEDTPKTEELPSGVEAGNAVYKYHPSLFQ